MEPKPVGMTTVGPTTMGPTTVGAGWWGRRRRVLDRGADDGGS